MFGDKQKFEQIEQSVDRLIELVDKERELNEAFQTKIVEHVEALLMPAMNKIKVIEQRLREIDAALESGQDDVQVLALEGNALRVDVNGLIETTSQTSAYLAGLIGNLKDAVAPFEIQRDPSPTKPASRPLEERGFKRPGGKG